MNTIIIDSAIKLVQIAVEVVVGIINSEVWLVIGGTLDEAFVIKLIMFVAIEAWTYLLAMVTSHFTKKK